MEERRSWLPAGLESSGWQPDDRASQRGPSASGSPWEPYDPDRPESKRSQKSPDPAPADAGKGDRTQQREPEQQRQQTQQQAKPAESKSEQRDEQEPKRESDGDGDGQQGGRSTVDALGQDKHRTIIGQRYGASRAKQLVYYGAFIAFVVAAYLGLGVAVKHFDKAPAHDKAAAPWAQKDSPNEPLGGFEPKAKGQTGPTHFQ